MRHTLACSLIGGGWEARLLTIDAGMVGPGIVGLDHRQDWTETAVPYFHVVTHHLSLMYYEATTRRICHGPRGWAPVNLLLDVKDGQARWVWTSPDGTTQRPLHVVTDQGFANFDDDECGYPWKFHQEPRGRATLQLGQNFLSADGDGMVRNTRPVCREWEHFTLISNDIGAAIRLAVPTDSRNLNVTLSELPQTLEYTGEFGNELFLFLPFIYWLDSVGILKFHELKTYSGMKSFYTGVTPRNYIEKHEKRYHVHVPDRPIYWPNKEEDKYVFSPFYKFPDFRTIFSNEILNLTTNKPLLIIHNKYNIEWSDRPINFLSIDLLQTLFEMATDVFTIIYIRHRRTKEIDGFSWDEDKNININKDLELLNKFDHVFDFYDLYKIYGRGRDINHFKNILCAKTFYYISSQGGGTFHLSYFSGSCMAILHRRGAEMHSAYGSGFFRVTSSPPAHLLICLNNSDVIDSMKAMLNSCVASNRVLLSPKNKDIIERLSPEAQKIAFYK